MLADHFPLVGLRLSTPQLELRLPSSEEALSGALEHNLPSLAVSRKLGYQPTVTSATRWTGGWSWSIDCA